MEAVAATALSPLRHTVTAAVAAILVAEDVVGAADFGVKAE